MKVVGIPLGGAKGVGKYALVDEIDVKGEIAERQWTAAWMRELGKLYAIRSGGYEGGTNRVIAMHRVIMQAPPHLHVDHINGDSLDNRRCNMRLATRVQNAANKNLRRDGAHPRYKGITLKPSGKWVVQISRGDGHGVRVLGTYDSPEEAAMVYDMAAVQMWGEFALTNAMIAARKEVPPPVIDYIVPRPRKVSFGKPRPRRAVDPENELL